MLYYKVSTEETETKTSKAELEGKVDFEAMDKGGMEMMTMVKLMRKTMLEYFCLTELMIQRV